MELYEQTPEYLNMVITSNNLANGVSRENLYVAISLLPSAAETEREHIRLERVHIVPQYSVKDSTPESRTILFKNEKLVPMSKPLTFQNRRGNRTLRLLCSCSTCLLEIDMFQFQQAMTGYKVIYDEYVDSNPESNLQPESSNQYTVLRSFSVCKYPTKCSAAGTKSGSVGSKSGTLSLWILSNNRIPDRLLERRLPP
jgi:hypothetical protein